METAIRSPDDVSSRAGQPAPPGALEAAGAQPAFGRKPLPEIGIAILEQPLTGPGETQLASRIAAFGGRLAAPRRLEWAAIRAKAPAEEDRQLPVCAGAAERRGMAPFPERSREIGCRACASPFRSCASAERSS